MFSKTVWLAIITCLISILFSFYTEAEASGSGINCTWCMDISSAHWDHQYNRWDCPKLFCGEGEEYFVSSILNSRSKCRKVYLSKVKKLCDKHTKCKECGKGGNSKHRDKVVTIIKCEECNEELSRETTKDNPNKLKACSVSYKTKREGICEACVKCGYCQDEAWKDTHIHYLKQKYACCIKDKGTIPDQHGSCWETQTKNTWWKFCGECECPFALGATLKFKNKKLKPKACKGKLGWGVHWVHVIYAQHCRNCEESIFTITSKVTTVSCSIMPWSGIYVDSCGKCEK